jgi:hypothetical protein
LAAIEALKDDSVIVFINGLDLYDSPDLVQTSMTSGLALGSPLPIVATFDAALKKELGVVPYRMMKDANGFTAVKAAIAMNRGEEVAPEKLAQALPEMWKDSRGRTMRATFVKSAGDDVTFLLRNGKQSTLKLSDLSEASQKRVAELAKK